MEARSVSFSLSLLFFWIQGSISVDRHFVMIDTRNTILGIIPAGSNSQSIPLSNISNASLYTSYKIGRMILGFLIFLWGFFEFTKEGDPIGGIIILFIAILLIGNGIVTVLAIGRAGSDYYVSVPFYEKTKMIEISDAINDMLIYTEDKKDVTANSDRIIDAINSRNQ